jgi:hypothetical protein
VIPAADRSLAYAALVSWILTESFGLFMARSWVTSGAARRRHAEPDGMSLPVLLGHAGLAFSGFLCWISFLLTGAAAAAWLALVLLAPAIGLGISTVTLWTPYPVRRADQATATDGRSTGVLPDDVIKHALTDEALASRLVDDLLMRNLANEPPPGSQRPNPRAIIPALHGVLAIATFLLGTLAAVSVS